MYIYTCDDEFHVLMLLCSLVIWPTLVSAMLQCQLQPVCVCGDPNVHAATALGLNVILYLVGR